MCVCVCASSLCTWKWLAVRVHIKRCGLQSQAKLCSSSAMDRTVQLALLCLQACLLISAFTSPDTQTDALLKENPLSSDSMVDEITTERPAEMEKDLDKVARGCRLRPGACGPLTKNSRTKRQVETRPARPRVRKVKRKRPTNHPGFGSLQGLAGPVEDHRIPNHHSENGRVVACFGEDHIPTHGGGLVGVSGLRGNRPKHHTGGGSVIGLAGHDEDHIHHPEPGLPGLRKHQYKPTNRPGFGSLPGFPGLVEDHRIERTKTEELKTDEAR